MHVAEEDADAFEDVAVQHSSSVLREVRLGTMVAPVGFARYRQPCADPIVCWSAPAIATLRPWLVNRCHCRGSTATRCRCGEWRESDIPRLVEAFNDPVIVGTLLDPVLPFTEEHARARLERFETARRDRAGVTAAVVTDGPAIGLLGLTGLDWQHESGTLGYWMHADGRGRGLAAAGVNLFVAWAFETLGPARVELTTSPSNTASRSLAARCGFVCEGRLRSHLRGTDGRRDSMLYSRLPVDPVPAAG
ncbi:hypothetical protein GCM10009533_16510 [Saccharopolyspora spinosporotrichia]|uniref:N-acetyltransferase domain-containing protein n=2 Tax=Saccharopolyspora erythraea TaxID=1836 RepID=A0ABN1CH54_SACER